MNYVIINEQHKILPQQGDILHKEFADNYEIIPVPSKGWSIKEMDSIINNSNPADTFVFISPIPYMIKWTSIKRRCLIFHNDKRNKKELPNGIISGTPAKTGWILI